MIQEYTSNDIKSMAEIWLRASLLAHPFISSIYWFSQMEDMQTKYLPSTKNYVYIDDECGTIEGFLSMADDYIAALFVDPSRQRQGIGRQLLDKAKSMYTSLHLAVYGKNVNAVRFYMHEGFTITEEREDVHTGEKEYVMVYRRL